MGLQLVYPRFLESQTVVVVCGGLGDANDCDVINCVAICGEVFGYGFERVLVPYIIEVSAEAGDNVIRGLSNILGGAFITLN